MKRSLFFTALMIFGTFVYAQTETKSAGQDTEMKTLFNSKKPVKLGWFVTFDPSYTKINGHDAYLGGFSGGMIIDHHFSIGLLGRGWYSGHEYHLNNSDTVSNLVGGYGGLLLEYTLFPRSLVHLNFPVIIAGGGASYVESWNKNSWNYYDHHNMVTFDNDAFFVFEPGVRAEINLVKWMRLNAGVSYRLVSGLHLIETPSDGLNSFTATMGLKFGKF